MKYELEISEHTAKVLCDVAQQFGNSYADLDVAEQLEVGIDILVNSYDAQFDESPGLPTSTEVSRDELRESIERITNPSIAMDVVLQTPQGNLDLGEK